MPSASLNPGTAELSGIFTVPGTYDLQILLVDYNGVSHPISQTYTDTFVIDFGGMAPWDGVGVYDVNIGVTNQAAVDCGSYCSMQVGVPSGIVQAISALTANCP